MGTVQASRPNGRLHVPDSDALPFRQRLAANLSDLLLTADPEIVGADVTPVEVSFRTHFVAMDELAEPRGDPLRRRNDPMRRMHQHFAAHREDFAAVEPRLLRWLRAAPENAEQFAENPAAALADLSEVAPDLKARLAPMFARRSQVMPQIPGGLVKSMTFDAFAAPPPADPPPVGKASVDIQSDAQVEIGLSQLTRIFAEKVLPGIRQAAANVSFVNSAIPGTVRLLDGLAGDPVLARTSGDTLRLTIGFSSGQLALGGLAPTVTALGAVTIEAQLRLTSPTQANGQRLGLDLVSGSMTVSTPAGVVATVWTAAADAIKTLFGPLLTYQVPLSFPPGLCDLNPHTVAASFLSPGGNGTQDVLALGVALFDGATPGFAADARSHVATGQDGAVLISNRLAVEIACCLLSQTPELAGVDHAPATNSDAVCSWRDIENFRLGDTVYDRLVSLDIRAQDGGLKTSIKLETSGFGWRATITGSADIKLSLLDGKIGVSAVTKLDIDTDVALWVYLLAVLLFLAGAAVLIFTKGWGAKYAVGLFTIGAGLLVLSLGFLLAGIAEMLLSRVEELADPNQLLSVLPTGLADGFGQLSFLTSLEWDDLRLGGYMTTPGSPRLIAGGDVVIPPGWGIDLDSGELVPPVDLTARMDVDLRLRVPPGLVMARAMARPDSGSTVAPVAMALGHVAARRDTIGPLFRTSLEAVGASRLVPFGMRPYATIGYFDLVELPFPSAATAMTVPSAAPPGVEPSMRTLAVRTSAGRLSSCAVWTDAQHRTILRYRTFDTPMWLTLSAGGTYVDNFGKPEFGQSFVLHGNYTAIPGEQWPPESLTGFQWYWSGTALSGAGLLDAVGNRYTVVGNRCLIETVQGADLNGWLCVVATQPSGLEAVACRNVNHRGKFSPPPDPGDGFGNPGSPGGGQGFGGFGGGPTM